MFETAKGGCAGICTVRRRSISIPIIVKVDIGRQIDCGVAQWTVGGRLVIYERSTSMHLERVSSVSAVPAGRAVGIGVDNVVKPIVRALGS